MRKDYTLLLLVLCISTALSAHRTIQLSVNLVKPAQNEKILVGKEFDEKVVITNNGPDVIKPGDSLIFVDPYAQSLGGVYIYKGYTKNVGDTIQVNIHYPGFTDNGIYNSMVSYCVGAYFTNDNTTDSVVVTQYYTDCNDIIINAQKIIDLQVTVVSPANNSTIQIVEDTFDEKIVIKNLGPDIIEPGDTLGFVDPTTPSGSYYIASGYSKNVNDTIQINVDSLSFNNTNQPGQINWCVGAFFFNGNTIDLSGQPASSCNSITLINPPPPVTKTIQLSVNILSPANGADLVTGSTYSEKVVITNLGPDAIVPADTLFYSDPSSPFGSGAYFSKKGYTKGVMDTIQLNRSRIAPSIPTTAQAYCINAYVSNGKTIGTVGNPYSDCNNVGVIDTTTPPSAVASYTGAMEKIIFYPNPANSEVNFNYTAKSNSVLTAHVYDVVGREVMSHDFGSVTIGDATYKLDIAMLRTGMYIIELKQEDARFISSINKQ